MSASITHSSFEFIKLSKERQMAMLNQEITRLVEAIRNTKVEQGKKENLKQLETAKKNIETKLARLAQTKRHDDEFSFEQMGIDDITVDEAHEFKNLFFTTKMQGIKGLGNPTGSNKAMDLWLKTQYLHQSGGSVAFMTGTPISNSAAEMHAVMRYLMPDTLDEMGLDNFDAWANTYAENTAKFEATEGGQLKLSTRFAREWQNMTSLMSLWQQVTDSVTNDDIKKTYKEETGKEFPLPKVDGGTRQSVVVTPTQAQEQILQMILAGFAVIDDRELDKEEAAVLRLQLMDLATKNALDPRTINPYLEAGGKIGAVVDNVFDTYNQYNDDLGTQIIFLDRSMPKGRGDDKKIVEYEALLARRETAIDNENDEELLKINEALDKFDSDEMSELLIAKAGGFNAYDEIKKGLIARGIPADEIAFVQEAKTDEDKKALFEEVNAGRVRVIIGSTPRMGAGTNIQNRLVALHHVDAPWKPSDIEQREGRIIRQGNELYAKYGHDEFKVEINAYVTEKTADAKRWGTMAAKLGTINGIRHYKGEHSLDFGDDENDSFQEIAALATGNPLMRERVELIAQKDSLARAKLNHQKRQAGNASKLKQAQSLVASLPKKIESLTKSVQDFDKLLPKAQEAFDKIGIEIDGKWFTMSGNAGDYLDSKAKKAQSEGKKVSYVINGESVSGLTNAVQKLKQVGLSKKPMTPTLITVGNQTYANIGEAVNDTVISQVNKHQNDKPIAKIMGFIVHSYDMGKNTLLAVETQDGYELTNTTLDHYATTEKVENAFARLVNTLSKHMGNNLSHAQNQLKIANDTIKQLKGTTGKPFANEQELKEISERLDFVQSQLSGNDENQFNDDDRFNDLINLLDSRAIGGSTGKAFVPTAQYDFATDDVDGLAEVDYDELTPSQQKAVDALNSLSDTDPNKTKLLQEVYALDRSDSDTAKQQRSEVTKKATTYELVVRKTGQVANDLKTLGYTVKTSKITPKEGGYTATITAQKGDRVIDIRVHRMMNEHRTNDPTKNGFFVNENGVEYSFSVNEPAIAQGIDTYFEYKTNGNYGKDRPELTYTNGTDWQEKMRPQIARLMDDDPRLGGFAQMANNEKLAGSHKNEILLALTAYADKQAVVGNGLYPHEITLGFINNDSRKVRQDKQDKPYFGKDRPKFKVDAKAGGTKLQLAGQLARLFDDDPRLAEFTERANTLSPLKQVMVLDELKTYAYKQAETGNALFDYEVIERKNKDYHSGKMKFSRMGRFGTTFDEVIALLNNHFGKDTIKALQNNGSLKVLSYAQAQDEFGAIPSDADGFYVGNTAYLIHDNIHPDMVVPTFLHELGGHGGLQTLMSDTAYQSLMKEFDRLVEQGDKTAIKAKQLADKNTNSKTEAQDEYLPYLITLASRQNTSAIKRLLNRMALNIKAFVRNKLGVKLAITPQDIVALAEKSVRDRVGARTGNKGDLRYSLNENTDSEFALAVDDVFANNYRKHSQMINLGHTPKAFVQVGLDDTPMLMDKAKLAKIKADHPEMTANLLKQIPKQLNNPVVIFKNTKETAPKNSYVALTELVADNGDSVIVAIHANKTHNGLEFNKIASIYGRNSSKLYIKNMVKFADVRFVDKQKANRVALELQLLDEDTLSLLFDKAIIAKDSTQSNQDLNNFDIKFSRMADFYEQSTDTTKKAVESLTKVASEFIANPQAFVSQNTKQAVKNGVSDHLGKFLQFLNRRQLTEIYGKKLDGLVSYNNRVAQMDADSNENAFRADTLANKWAKVKDDKELATLMNDVTLFGIDPSMARQTGVNAVKYGQLKARYDRLSDSAKEVFNQAKDDYQAHYKAMHKAMSDRIKRNDKLSTDRKVHLLAKLDNELKATQKVFFPLTRFGDYVVVVKDQDGNVVNISRAETRRQADEMRRQLIKDNPNHSVGAVTLGRDLDVKKLKGIKGLASEFMNDDLGLDDDTHKAYLNSLLDRQFATNNVMIKNTAGFSQNARRAYAYHMTRGGHYIAKLRHTDQLQADLKRMQASVDDNVGNPNFDHIALQRVVDEMNKRHALLLNPPSSPVSTMATAVGFMWYMGLSPASALVNLSQTLLVGLPMMGAKYGFTKSSKMLGEVSGLLVKNKNDLTDVLAGDEKKALDEAVRRGVIDMTQANDLAGVANGEDSGVSKMIKKPMKIASFMFHQAEKFNRQVTFVASYRLAVQKGLSSDEALDEAIDVTYKSHFDYASSNRPRFMQGNWQRVLFLFKQYGQNMIYTLVHNTLQSFKGETPQKRAEARKILAGILAGHAMTAGVLGLPVAITAPLLAAFSALGGDDDDELTDNETEFRNALANLLGDDLAQMLAKGLPRGVGVDLSSRVGLDSLILPRLQDGLEGQRWGENMMVGAMGAVAGIPVSMAKGVQQMGQGQTMQGIENMIPKALRDPLKAYRYMTQGNVDKSGIEIVAKENVGVSDIGQQALGFRSGKFAQAQEVKSAVYQAEQKLKAIKKQMKDKYAQAYRDDDKERMNKIWADIQAFNAKYPTEKITKPNLMRSIKERQKRIDNAKDGIYLSKNREHLRAYGEFGVD